MLTRSRSGAIQKQFQDATCGDIAVEGTFMVQFCCGRDDCSAAGIINLPPRDETPTSAESTSGLVVGSASGGARSLRLAVNGAEIKPAYQGPPLAATTWRSKPVFTRDDGICDGEWVPVPGKEDYTRPADGAQLVSGLYTGPVEVSITTTPTELERHHRDLSRVRGCSLAWSELLKRVLGVFV